MHCQKSVFQFFFENTVALNIRLRMQPRLVTVEKMADIFTKRIWQPYCRLLFKNFCILCSVLPLLGIHSQALTLQGKFEFHKGLKVIRCCLGVPGKSGKAHQHLVASLAHYS